VINLKSPLKLEEEPVKGQRRKKKIIDKSERIREGKSLKEGRGFMQGKRHEACAHSRNQGRAEPKKKNPPSGVEARIRLLCH